MSASPGRDRRVSIYFNEYNLLMGSGGISYLPFVSGILSAYVKTNRVLEKAIKVNPFIFKPDSLESILGKYTAPDIACFSISMWNEQLSLSVAKRLRDLYPKILIIFGGSSCPHNPTSYMETHQFIDICVRAEGEEAFKKILERYVIEKCNRFYDIPNVAWRDSGVIIINTGSPEYDRSLDNYPSPYLTGEFDYLLNDDDHNYQAIVETNRGCPFLCTFCYWGRGGNNTKYRFRDISTVEAELDYLAKRRVKYIFNADSNFGMHKRDWDIAKKLVELKSTYGYPEKFRTCWGKNSSERIFKIASLLQYHDLDKGITLARQSNNPDVLLNIKRDNIKLEAYAELEKRFNRMQVPVYAELILGLPGETYESWIDGIDLMLDTGLNNQLFVYMAEVYPNTELGDSKYQEQFGITCTKIALHEIHCAPRQENWVTEFQHIVTSTRTMSNSDWEKMLVYSLVVLLLHSMKAGIYLLAVITRKFSITHRNLILALIESPEPSIRSIIDGFRDYGRSILSGGGRGIYRPEWSDVYLDPEEVALLELCENKNEFYSAVRRTWNPLLAGIDSKIIDDLFLFQSSLIPSESSDNLPEVTLELSTNVAEVAYKLFYSESVSITDIPTALRVFHENFSSKHEFTRRRVVWARKSGTILNETDLHRKLKEENRVSFNVSDYETEEDFKVTLFEGERKKFGKFIALQEI